MLPEIHNHNSEAAKWKNPANSHSRTAEANKTVEFQKDPEERFSRILNIINTENKAFTVGFLLNNKIWRTTDDLERIAKGFVFPMFKPPKASQYQSYCTQTFIPIGVVAEEKIIVKGRTNPVAHYRLTEDGEKYAKPIARFALKTAVETGISMSEIFGATNSRGGTRAPYNRAKIILELQEQGSLSEAELEYKLALNHSTARNNLLALKEKGLVNYTSLSPEESGWSKYEWIPYKNPQDVLGIESQPNLTREIAYKMNEIKISDRNELAKVFKKRTRQNISQILTGLERQGFIRSIGEKSNATITEKGNELKFIREAFQSLKKDDLSEINKEIEIFNDNSVASSFIIKALKHYADVSRHSKVMPREDNKNAILSLLENQSLGHEQINVIRGKESGVYLKELLDSGDIIKKKKGVVVNYSLNPKKRN